MPEVTLVRSRNGSARDSTSGVVVRVGETVDVPEEVAARLRSTEALGDVYEVKENDQPATSSVVAVIEPARDAQEVCS